VRQFLLSKLGATLVFVLTMLLLVTADRLWWPTRSDEPAPPPMPRFPAGVVVHAAPVAVAPRPPSPASAPPQADWHPPPGLFPQPPQPKKP
jgi:hypothetical protein